jgi:predicted O-methyltransferase YrrM
MKSLLKSARSRLFAGLARQSDIDRLYDQISGLQQIQNAIDGKPLLRPLRGWAISPDAMACVLADLQERTAPAVIEFGSGQSTIILAAALKYRNGRLLSVEHDPEYCAVIQRQVTACGLSELVQFIHAPICLPRDIPGHPSYDTTVIPDCLIDLALIDGPPFKNGLLTRLTALRWAALHLKPGGAIFLDDSNREGEQACLKQLHLEFPALQTIRRSAEKGLTELRSR